MKALDLLYDFKLSVAGCHGVLCLRASYLTGSDSQMSLSTLDQVEIVERHQPLGHLNGWDMPRKKWVEKRRFSLAFNVGIQGADGLSVARCSMVRRYLRVGFLIGPAPWRFGGSSHKKAAYPMMEGLTKNLFSKNRSFWFRAAYVFLWSDLGNWKDAKLFAQTTIWFDNVMNMDVVYVLECQWVLGIKGMLSVSEVVPQDQHFFFARSSGDPDEIRIFRMEFTEQGLFHRLSPLFIKYRNYI